MIWAGMLLLAVGGADLVRQFAPPRRRWAVFLIAAVLLLLVAGPALDAVPAAITAALGAAAWVSLVSADGARRTGIWAAAVLAALCAAAVLAHGPRSSAGPLSEAWHPQAPFGPVAVDAVVAVLGAGVFLLESGNVIVRSALRREMTTHVPTGSSLKGGRLIGPLERVLVFALTLAGAYTLLAAVLAAKGIVRFPEISRDGENGDRAEYFLVGSLVSWACALGAAVLVWWGAVSIPT